MLGIISTVLYSGIAVLLFVASTVPLASLNTSTNSTVHPTVRTVYNRLHKLHAVNQYGLFNKILSTDGRPEIVLEGADNLEGPWLEYSSLYKPGNINHSLPFVGTYIYIFIIQTVCNSIMLLTAPYSPRLDWQFHWAAHSTYDKQPWVLSLAHRILTGRPEVLALLDRHHSPFVQKPPKYLRAILYKYKYSSWSER